jgi:peptidoglycan/LPS O-acetylase OafA/YrhL
MRSLAIIFVVMGHGGSMLDKANTNFPWIKLIDGVELFFVLSGFLIGKILLETFDKDPLLTFRTITWFWFRRWLRTLPNYYLVLLLNIIIVYFGIIKEDFTQFNWRFFFFLQNFSNGFYDFFWESWSLSVEEWFYILFPLLLYLLCRLFYKTTPDKKNLFLTATLLFVGVSFFLRATIASKIKVDQFWLGVNILKVVIYRFDGIALGILAAYIKYWHPNFWVKRNNLYFIGGIIICYYCLYSHWDPNNFSTKVYKPFIQSIGCFLLLPKFDSIKTGSVMVVKIFTHISLISYSMYLLNLAVVAEVLNTNFPPKNVLQSLLSYFVYWILVVVISTLLYKYFEKPIMDLRNKLQQK